MTGNIVHQLLLAGQSYSCMSSGAENLQLKTETNVSIIVNKIWDSQKSMSHCLIWNIFWTKDAITTFIFNILFTERVQNELHLLGGVAHFQQDISCCEFFN